METNAAICDQYEKKGCPQAFRPAGGSRNEKVFLG